MVLSENIFAEFKEAMQREEVATRFAYSRSDISEFVKSLREVAEITKIKSNFAVVEDDLNDDAVLNAAYDGKKQIS